MPPPNMWILRKKYLQAEDNKNVPAVNHITRHIDID